MDDADDIGFWTAQEIKTTRASALDCWRLCDELTVAEAALLQASREPDSEALYKIKHSSNAAPAGYESAVKAFSRALAKRAIEGRLVPQYNSDDSEIPDSVNIYESLINVKGLKAWLISRGVNSGFFFPEPPPSVEYLDPSNGRYAPKLAAAVQAWLAVGDEVKAKTPKMALTKWLNEHAGRFGLADDAGVPKKSTIDDIAKVANWEQEGGAPKTPG